jgi:hypothetical protein
VQDTRSRFRTMGVSFVGFDFLDFLTLIAKDKRYDSDFLPKKKKKKRVKNLECLINFDVRSMGSSKIKGKKLGV